MQEEIARKIISIANEEIRKANHSVREGRSIITESIDEFGRKNISVLPPRPKKYGLAKWTIPFDVKTTDEGYICMPIMATPYYNRIVGLESLMKKLNSLRTCHDCFVDMTGYIYVTAKEPSRLAGLEISFY